MGNWETANSVQHMPISIPLAQTMTDGSNCCRSICLSVVCLPVCPSACLYCLSRHMALSSLSCVSTNTVAVLGKQCGIYNSTFQESKSYTKTKTPAGTRARERGREGGLAVRGELCPLCASESIVTELLHSQKGCSVAMDTQPITNKGSVGVSLDDVAWWDDRWGGGGRDLGRGGHWRENQGGRSWEEMEEELQI